MKKILIIISILISTTFSTIAQSEKLPVPSGEYCIGIKYLCFTDSSRKEIFDNNFEKVRNITVKVWYPSDIEALPKEPYFMNVEPIIKYFSFPEIYREIITNSSRNVPLSNRRNKFPVLIFNHGWGEHFAQNTILMEELASHGYIIFSIAHHYECKFSFYPDGKFIPIDMNSERFQKIMREQQDPIAMKLLIKMSRLINISEQKSILEEQRKSLPTLLNETPKYWADDISFFLSKLEIINRNDSILNNHLDLDKIGVFGMSMGGIATNEICMKESKIKAGINIDGGFYNFQSDDSIQVPYMFLNSRRYLEFGELFTDQINNESYSITILNSDHYNLTDYSIYPIPGIHFLLGTIEGSKSVSVMNDMVLLFFEKYIKNKNIDILKEAQSHPELNVFTDN